MPLPLVPQAYGSHPEYRDSGSEVKISLVAKLPATAMRFKANVGLDMLQQSADDTSQVFSGLLPEENS